jgi:hypothetical protein
MLCVTMARLRAGLQRFRPWAALAPMTLAALLLIGPMIAQLADPAWPPADEFQPYLDSWARVLAPVEELVPAGEVLGYACRLDEHGRPVESLERWFEFIRAVLAPRRITRRLDTRFLLAHCDTSEEPTKLPGLAHARVLAELAQGVFLVERTSP